MTTQRDLKRYLSKLASTKRGVSLDEMPQPPSEFQPDTCLLCGRQAMVTCTVDDLFKLTYGLCWTCSAKPTSHTTACDVITRHLREAAVTKSRRPFAF